jgi:transcriptional regulator with XRE-family HTH domain
MAATGDRIRELREKRSLTQDQLAEKAGISKGFLSDVENNKRNISSQVLLRIANSLGTSVDYLLQGTLKQTSKRIPVVIPPNLSVAAEALGLTYKETSELLETHDSVYARRSKVSQKELSVEDWKKLYAAIKKVFG